MGLYQPAVDMALRVDPALARQTADMPEDDQELRKKLWLRIGNPRLRSQSHSLTVLVPSFPLDCVRSAPRGGGGKGHPARHVGAAAVRAAQDRGRAALLPRLHHHRPVQGQPAVADLLLPFFFT